VKVVLLIIGILILLLAIYSWAAVLELDFASPILKVFDHFGCEGRCIAYVAIGSTILGVFLFGLAQETNRSSFSFV
jgi:hypothetical protein